MDIETPFVGPVVDVSPRDIDPDEPANLCTYTAVGANIGSYLKWQPDLFGGGCAFKDKAAKLAALGEYVERYCANFVPEGLLKATQEELITNNEVALHPEKLFPFTDAQEIVRSGRFTKPKTNDRIEWVKMTGTRSEILAPAALVFLNYYRIRPQAQRNYPVLLPGIAAGRSFSQALESALTEVLERDATSLWWLAGRSAKRVILPQHFFNEMGKFDQNKFACDGLLLRTYGLENKYYAAAFVLRDLEKMTVQVGFACRSSLSEALYKSAAEAWQLRRLTEAIRDKNSWAWQQDYHGTTLLPLLEKQPTQVNQLTQLVHNIQYYLDRSKVSNVYKTLSEKIDGVVELNSVNSCKPSVEASLAEIETTENMKFFWRDVTTYDMLDSGYRVIRVYSPQACPNLPSAFPPLANVRLRKELTLTGKTLCLEPLPHA